MLPPCCVLVRETFQAIKVAALRILRDTERSNKFKVDNDGVKVPERCLNFVFHGNPGCVVEDA